VSARAVHPQWRPARCAFAAASVRERATTLARDPPSSKPKHRPSFNPSPSPNHLSSPNLDLPHPLTRHTTSTTAAHSGQHISSSLTLPLGRRPGQLLMGKVLQYMRPKCHALLLDDTINGGVTVRLNIFQVGVRGWGLGVWVGFRLGLGWVWVGL